MEGGYTNPEKFVRAMKPHAERAPQGTVSRRTFLARLGACLATSVVGGVGVEQWLKREGEHVAGESAGGDEIEPVTREQDVIGRADADVVEKTLEEQLKERGAVTLNEGTMRAIRARWEALYREGGARHRDLVQALARMAPWREWVEREFREEGVDTEYALLAIAESHFTVDARSPVGATGPYQFMRDTAALDLIDLSVDAVVDDRRDPIRSARACAKLLRDNARKLNDDWDLALSAYNGSFAWSYAKKTPRASRSYSEFLKFIEAEIRARVVKQEQEKASGQTRSGLSRLLSDYVQNINYPAKHKAIVRAVREREERMVPGFPVAFRELTTGMTKRKTVTHKIVKGETAQNVGRMYRLSARDVAHMAGGTVRHGDVLTIPIVTEYNVSLTDLAARYRVPVGTLAALNPGVLAYDRPLPDRYVIRLPVERKQIQHHADARP